LQVSSQEKNAEKMKKVKKYLLFLPDTSLEKESTPAEIKAMMKYVGKLRHSVKLLRRAPK